jgi:5-methyltetrahydrofolate--homocysteine methyltransferase
MFEELIDAMVQMNEQEALGIARQLIDKEEDPLKILVACSEALEIVGKRFEEGEYFLPQLVMGGEMLRQISDLLKPKLKEAPEVKHRGKILIGTVKDDLHDLGKDIVVFMLEVNGFDVLDLGIDVPPEKFVSAIREFKPQVVGLSGFLSIAFESMKETVQTIRGSGLHDSVKIMIGGGQIDEEVRRYTGADAYGLDAMAAVSLSKGWIGGN